MSETKSKVLFILGPKSSGKSTLAKLISEYFSFYYFTIEDLIRQEVLKESEFGLFLKKALKNQKKITFKDQIILFKKEIDSHPRG